MQLHGTAKIGENGHLYIGGVDTSDLKNEYSTPLFIYDEELIRNQCRRFHKALSESGLKYHISYASKAFICKKIARLMNEENMGLDVVSIGEMYNAISAGFPAEKIHFHGNNKTTEEIKYALEKEIGCFVVDSFEEIERLSQIAREMVKSPKAILRVNPGVEAHTHEFISTGNSDSKFGLNIKNGQAIDALNKLVEKDNIDVLGIHFHIGSQIFVTSGFKSAVENSFSFLKTAKDELGFTARVLNLGGGYGIRYTDEDLSYPVENALEEIIDTVKSASADNGLEIPEIWMEPGRSIVGEAGYTLYTVGTIKEIPDIRTYVSIDGGMSDHIRTALYGAKYEVALANRMNDENTGIYTIAGKCCESGDILVRDAQLPQPKPGDLAVISCTGAYHYSMASNYNQMARPAVVFVKDSKSELAIKRESLEDLIKNQL